MEFDLETLLKLGASIIGLLLALSKLFESKVNLKQDLKLHLEIRNLIEKGSEEYNRVDGRVSELVNILYPTDAEYKVRDHEESKAKSYLLSLITGISFSIWTLWIIFSGFSWWCLLTAFIAFSAFSSFKETLDSDKNKN
ncbi:MAG: hypothetical protein ACJAT7_002765 [Psychromonas sp.]|jgi:hypothetical protein|uniref:hypothetical protein n=1 Tax=Psychromonas sp. TaxID=1884585 RepID=UPI0039E35261